MDLDKQAVLSGLASKANLYTYKELKILQRFRPVLPARGLLPDQAGVCLDHFG